MGWGGRKNRPQPRPQRRLFSTKQNITGPGALAPPDTGLGRRGHLERRRRRDARARGAGAGEEGALRCVERREARETTPSLPPLSLLVSSSSAITARLFFTIPLFVPYFNHFFPGSRSGRMKENYCQPRKKHLQERTKSEFFLFVYYFLSPKKTHLRTFLSKVPLRDLEVLWFSRSCSSPACL